MCEGTWNDINSMEEANDKDKIKAYPRYKTSCFILIILQ